MKRIAAVLQVSRSNLVDRKDGRTRPRGPYRKAGDASLLPLIRRFVDERPTYGYRRITALVARALYVSFADADFIPALCKISGISISSSGGGRVP